MRHIGSRQRLGLMAVLAVLCGAAVAVALPGSSAVAFLSPPDVWQVQVQSPGTLLAKGAAVAVPVEVTCPAGRFAYLQVSLTQRSGNEATSATRYLNLTCPDGPTVLRVNVSVSGGSRTFKRGPAFAEAVLDGCGYMCGSMSTDSREISLSK